MNNNGLKHCVLALVLGGLSGTAQATLITNGIFDSDLSGWSIDTTLQGGTSDGVIWSDDAVNWDGGLARVGQPGTPGVTEFFQVFNIPTGSQALSVSFEYLWQSNKPTIEDFFQVELTYDTNGGSQTVVLLNEGSVSGNFSLPQTAFSQTIALSDLAIVAPTGEVRFTLTENNSSAGTRVHLDNVAAQAVPVPATLALMLLGVAGIGWSRSRSRKA
ncbi:MAG: PEP-CTERM sorting domain-containing protein [Gammaproteobacteria bacterium]|nr:PEP-CTERM sorting domain-containing protein [Gammaproteobacteria bacterium]